MVKEKGADDEALAAYLTKPVTCKKKTGEANFLQLATCLLLDLKDFHSEVEYITWYMAIAMNLYMHNATYSPMPGYGKVQRVEYNYKETDKPKSEIQYYRSQTDHPRRKRFDDFVKKKKVDTRRTGLLPSNTAFAKLIQNALPNTSLSKALSKLDKRGFPKTQGETLGKNGHYGELFAHSGVRANNLMVDIQGLSTIAATENLEGNATKEQINQAQIAKLAEAFSGLFKGEKNSLTAAVKKMHEKFSDTMPKTLPKTIAKLKVAKVIARVKAINSQFEKLQVSANQLQVNNNLYSCMLQQRIDRAKKIATECKNLQLDKLNIATAKDSSFLYVDLYPGFTDEIRRSKNYSEGVTNNFAVNLEELSATDIFPHSYWHALLKLYNNCSKAVSLLNSLSELEETHCYAKATLLIENILEYLINLDSLQQIRNKKNGKIVQDPIEKLQKNEKQYVNKSLGLEEEQVDLFFTDSGQQANVASILTMDMQIGDREDCRKVFLFDESYFELQSFFDDVAKNVNPEFRQTNDSSAAEICFIDITKLDKFKLSNFGHVKLVIIDITNNPDLNNHTNNQTLKDLVTTLHAQDIWVVLTASSLKHDQLGLDKYQAGKIITLAPPKQELNKSTLDELVSISKEAMHSGTAAYLHIVNMICQKTSQDAICQETPQVVALKKHGIFANNGQQKIETEHPHTKEMSM